MQPTHQITCIHIICIYKIKSSDRAFSNKEFWAHFLSLEQCCGSGSGIRCLIDPWIRDPEYFFSGSRSHIFESFLTIIWVKSSIILKKLVQIIFFNISNKIIYNFVKFVATKTGMTTNFFFTPLFCCCFFDPGSEIRDPGWVKIRIRDKHPGSAILVWRAFVQKL